MHFEPFEFGIFWKSQRWVPPKNIWVDEKSEVDADSKKCKICVVQMAKNLVHSFYHILYQPKGVPTPSYNFSGTGDIIFEIVKEFWILCSCAFEKCITIYKLLLNISTFLACRTLARLIMIEISPKSLPYNSMVQLQWLRRTFYQRR